MNNAFAEFISPLVSHLHHSDPTINSIHFSYPSKSYFSSIEEILTKENIEILQLISRGTEITINSKQVHKIQQISILLCNDDLFESLQKLYPESNKEQKFENI